jgi:hypothetical protein
MRAFFLPLALVAAIACTTSGDEPPQNGEGPFVTLNGGSFDKLALNALDGAGVLDAGRFRALVEDRASICSTSARRQNSTVLTIETPSGAPGTYPNASVEISKLDATCANAQSYASESGTVTITSASSTVIAGTFDVTLANGAGTLKGSFNIPVCPSLKLDTCDP